MGNKSYPYKGYIVTIKDGDYIATKNGKFICKAENEPELEAMLDNESK